MAMTASEQAKWMKDLVDKLSLGSSYIKMSYYNPKNLYDDTMKFYYIYINPILISMFSIWLIVLLRALPKKDFGKKFGFMTAYSATEMVCQIITNIFTIYVLTFKEDYVEYEMCYAFEISTRALSHCRILISQWLKVAQCIQRYIILYKPIDYTSIFSARNVVLCIVVLVLACFTVSFVDVYLIDFQKVVTLDTTNMEPVEICRETYFFSEEKYVRQQYYTNLVDNIFVVFGYALPLLCFVSFSILAILKIRKQNRFRRQFFIAKTEVQASSDRLVKVIIASTILYSILSGIGIIFNFLMFNEILQFDFLQYASVTTQVIYIINIPMNFLLFCWLAEPFRNKMKMAWSKLRG